MDPKLREKTKIVFQTILKNCEAQRSSDSNDIEFDSLSSNKTARRFNQAKRPRRG